MVDSKGELVLPAVSKLSSEIVLLQIDVKQQMFRNGTQELEVTHLQQEIKIFKSQRNMSVNSPDNVSVNSPLGQPYNDHISPGTII